MGGQALRRSEEGVPQREGIRRYQCQFGVVDVDLGSGAEEVGRREGGCRWWRRGTGQGGRRKR